MNLSQQLLSDVVLHTKYARHIEHKHRRENWNEITDRYLSMMIKKYPELKKEILEKGKFIYNKDILMSMRAAQFAGPAIEKNESRVYNCCALPVDDYRAFSEIMFLLLGGTGVGFSVQFSHIEKLPEIQKPRKEQKYVVGDSIEGWADAVKALMKSYFGINKVKPRFDFSDIRAKGERLITAGGKAPGPAPLRTCLAKIEGILENKKDGDKLTSLEIHDIICHIADAVLSGGIRRAALISLFSADDIHMATCKAGNWWELNPQRGRANNSAVLLRHRITKDVFLDLWKKIEQSGSGEPGIYLTNNKEWLTNPCAEIALRPFQFCNLTEINAGAVIVGPKKHRQKYFNLQAEAAAFFGTLQAGFTDFHYLRPIWRKTTEKDALVGVGITGICENEILDLDLTEAANVAVEENKRVSKLININAAARVTTIKPSGTTSCVLGTSSGIHAAHSRYYIRNIQCKVKDDIYSFFSTKYPELIKIMDQDPNSAVIGIPIKSSENAILRENENAIEMLERVKRFQKEWVHIGHQNGDNKNNVSATVSISKDKYFMPDGKNWLEITGHEYEKDHYNEWQAVGEWMWKNRDYYNGLSVLPYDGGTYADAPFMECDEQTFLSKIEYIQNNPINLEEIKEYTDNTDLTGEIACGPSGCEII